MSELLLLLLQCPTNSDVDKYGIGGDDVYAVGDDDDDGGGDVYVDDDDDDDVFVDDDANADVMYMQMMMHMQMMMMMHMQMMMMFDMTTEDDPHVLLIL